MSPPTLEKEQSSSACILPWLIHALVPSGKPDPSVHLLTTMLKEEMAHLCPLCGVEGSLSGHATYAILTLFTRTSGAVISTM